MLEKFELLVPETLDEALSRFAELGSACKILAGGTDVLIEMHGGHRSYPLLMDIKGLQELRGVHYSPVDGLNIGALTTHRELERLPLIKELYTALYEGVSQVGCVQTRYRGTIGGNICNAAPSGESIGPLMALGARVVVQGVAGRRELPLREFFPGPKRTMLRDGELLIRILLPPPASNSGSAYTKFTRRNAMDLALLGSSAYLECDGEAVCSEARIALTTAAPTVIRAAETEKFLIGKVLTTETIKEAGQLASAEAKPRSSWRASEAYRRKILKVIVPKTITLAFERARGGAERS